METENKLKSTLKNWVQNLFHNNCTTRKELGIVNTSLYRDRENSYYNWRAGNTSR